MQALYLSDHGTGLRLKDRQLLVTDRDHSTVASYRPYRTGFDTVLVEENGGWVSFAALKWLATQGISFAGIRYDGRLSYATVPFSPTAGPVRLAQFRGANDERTCRAVAHGLVRARLATQERVLGWRHADGGRPMPDSIAQLRGYEGNATDAYFRAYAKRVEELWPDAGFVRRNASGSTGLTMNAVDPVNCLLNYAYAVVSARVLVAATRAGLDPLVSFYHRPGSAERNPPLVRDLVEPFRFLGELAVLDTIAAGKALRRDFIASPELVLRLGSVAKRTLVDRLQARMNRKAVYEGTRRVWETVMLRESTRLADWLKRPTATFDFRLPPIKSWFAPPTAHGTNGKGCQTSRITTQ